VCLAVGFILSYWLLNDPCFNSVCCSCGHALILSVALAGVANPTHVKCHLWKRFTDVNDQKVCVYRFSAGFGGLGYHYPTRSFSECPKVFSCVYEKKDKRPSLSEILDGLKGGF